MTNLSHRGRLALIRSVLQTTPLHLLQVIHPPKSVLTTIERIFMVFFLGSYNGRKHIHWSSWAKACFPVAEGGLGVQSLADYVRAFFMKLWWWFRSRSSLWSEYLHGRYCRTLHPTTVSYNQNHSPIWHRLYRIQDVAESFIFWTLGDGSVFFWHDNWLGEKPLAQLLHRDDYTMEPVSYYWDEGRSGDEIMWTGSNEGAFSTKLAWEAIQLFFHDRIPVDAKMKHKGFSFPSKCQCCEAEKTISHLFVESTIVQGVWQHFAALFRFRLCDTGNLTYMVHFWRRSGMLQSIVGCSSRLTALFLRSSTISAHYGSSSPSVVGWHTPSPSWFKLNTDSSSFGNPGLARAAGIIRDLDGHVHLAYHVALGTGTSVIAELTAIWRDLELAMAHGCTSGDPAITVLHFWEMGGTISDYARCTDPTDASIGHSTRFQGGEWGG
ncbi:UNVERIFIED_CONTAM: hypothetical protein Scaly_2226200 [Sesamum calycinum]|uniref:Uncharacterized protein n=1 Tax=Sesamum calycinum TaxID=2727403 RepID=A0AAW2MBW7_9LAMI